MPASAKALVRPIMLRWARQTASVTPAEAAKAATVSEARLLAWEDDDQPDMPTVNQLRTLANKYKRALSLFYLPEPPLDFQPLRDFRRRPEMGPGVFTAQLAYEIRAAYERREIALGIWEELGEAPAQFQPVARVAHNAEDAAARVRAVLGVDLETQFRWRDLNQTFKAWRDAIEKAGVLVFVLGGAHHKVDTGEMLGFAIAQRPLPTIVVNGRNRPGGKVFTLFHELGHIVLGQSVIENEIQPGADMHPPDLAIERFCNRFAAAVLMPRDALLRENVVANHRAGAEWSDEEIEFLANRYSVSREALLVRLVELGRVDQAFFEAKAAEYRREYIELDAEADAEEREFFPLPRYQVLNHLGKAFARLVLQGYYGRKLSLSTVSGYLGMQAKYVPEFERAAFSNG